MRDLFLIALLLTSLTACQEPEKGSIEGDFYVQRKDLSPLFLNLPDSTLAQIEQVVRTAHMDTMPKKGQNYWKWYKHLVDNGLLRKRYIRLLLDDGEEAILYMDSASYQLFAYPTLDDSIGANQKIRVKAQVRALPYGEQAMYDALQILVVKKNALIN